MQYIMAEVQANRYSRLPNKSTGHLLKKKEKNTTLYALIRNLYTLIDFQQNFFQLYTFIIF